jgi:C4-dicarboxylate transporter DctQ subunit
MLKVLDHLEEWLISTLMGLATIIIFVAVIHRYMSGMPIPGLQDWLLTLNFSAPPTAFAPASTSASISSSTA